MCEKQTRPLTLNYSGFLSAGVFLPWNTTEMWADQKTRPTSRGIRSVPWLYWTKSPKQFSPSFIFGLIVTSLSTHDLLCSWQCLSICLSYPLKFACTLRGRSGGRIVSIGPGGPGSFSDVDFKDLYSSFLASLNFSFSLFYCKHYFKIYI